MIFDVIIFVLIILLGTINTILPNSLFMPEEWINSIGYFLSPFAKWDWAWPFLTLLGSISFLIYIFAFKKFFKFVGWILSLIRGGSSGDPV